MASLEKEREEQLLREIPELLASRTLLYIGAKPERLQMIPLLFIKSFSIDALEAWKPNFDRLVAWNAKEKVFRKVFHGDIRLASTVPSERYDVVMFWHGPEHVDRLDLPFVLRTMERLATKLVVLASPWGLYKQGVVEGNPFEKHVSHLYPVDFEKFGYKTSTLGKKDQKGSNLLAWKRIESPKETE